MKHLAASLCALLALLPSDISAQAPFGARHEFSVSGSSDLSLFGWSVASGDVDGDGFSDVLVGGPSEALNGLRFGAVTVFSGRDGSLIYRRFGDFSIDKFGESVAVIGDLNGDGAEEFIVGAPQGMTAPGLRPGYARVFDGATGGTIITLAGSEYFDQFGFGVAAVGDIDGDGTTDIAIGAPRPQVTPPLAPGPGKLFVYSGATFQPLGSITGIQVYAAFGTSVDAAGDVNLDGVPDIVVGMPGYDEGGLTNRGRVDVYSGEYIRATAQGTTPQTSQVLGTSLGFDSNIYFGEVVAGVGDTNLDGYADVLGAAESADLTGTLSGSVDLLSGEWMAATEAGTPPNTPQRLDRFGGNGAYDSFGHSLTALGDIDGDGAADFMVGAPENFAGLPGSGYAVAFSGVTGDDLFTLGGQAPGDRCGWSLALANDINGDSAPDIVMGADFGSGAINGFGTAHAISIDELLFSADTVELSISQGGTQSWFVNGGDTYEDEFYWVVGSTGGIAPGIPLGGLLLPLNPSAYFNQTLNLGATPIASAFGMLTADGESFPSLPLAAGALDASAAGLRLDHLVVLFSLPYAGPLAISNSVPVRFVP